MECQYLAVAHFSLRIITLNICVGSRTGTLLTFSTQPGDPQGLRQKERE